MERKGFGFVIELLFELYFKDKEKRNLARVRKDGCIARKSGWRRKGFGFVIELLSELPLRDNETRNPGWERM